MFLYLQVFPLDIKKKNKSMNNKAFSCFACYCPEVA